MPPKNVVNNPGDILVKPKTKSRNGCLTCKKKRLKCDETKPFCLNCQKKKITCGGYATKFKWRSFNDSNDSLGIELMQKTANVPGYENRKRRLPTSDFGEQTPKIPRPDVSLLRSDKILRKHLELASLSVTGKSIKEIKIENDLIAKGLNPDSYKQQRSGSLTSLNNAELVGNLESSASQLGSKKLKRSYSLSETGYSPPTSSHLSALMPQRSFSTNSTAQLDLVSLRNEHSKLRSNGLDSLADAAVDEIKTRSPSMPSQEVYLQNKINHSSPGSNQIPFSPNLSEFLANNKSPESNFIKPSPKVPGSSIELTPINEKGSGFMSDLNLTPSLSALINYAFNSDADKGVHMNPDSIKMNIDVPLSPLNLNNSAHNDNSPINFTGSILGTSPTTNGQSTNVSNASSAGSSNNKITILSDTPISLLNTPSPTIYNGHTSQSLMRTSENEQILFLYSHYTCAIMSIKNGPNENPWRNMIVPLASSYPCLFNSIASMTLFHLAGNSEINTTSNNLRSKGYTYMKKCILELASGLSKVNNDSEISSELPADIALTTCLNLAVSESWDTHTSSGIAHLKGAKSMIQKVLALLRDQQQAIADKRREIRMSPGENRKEYLELVSTKRKDLQKKLVLVNDAEWGSMMEVNNIDSYQSNGEYLKVCLTSNNKDKQKNEKFNVVTIPNSLQFLFNIWIYFEVLAQMTADKNHDDKGIDLVATITSILQTSQEKRNKETSKMRQLGSESDLSMKTSPSGNSESSDSSFNNFDGRNEFDFFENFETFSYNTDYVDPLLGCAQPLFSIMGKVANLISKIRKSRRNEGEPGMNNNNTRNSLSTITLATQFKQQLMDWKPTISATMISKTNVSGICDYPNSYSTWDISSCIATAEAYRYATLLYLHQAVPEIPSLSSHQLAEKIFILLASIPTSSHTFVIHIFPLLVASCEAEPGEEREWCESRWSLLAEKMWIGNIDRALEVVKEVWRRKDEYIRKKRRTDLDESSFNVARSDVNNDQLRNISAQISGLMAVINNDQNSSPLDDIKGGINSRLHWSSVMKEWGWEVLLA